ncbi:hypothetical protein V8G54_010746 [Vigna mungo]|uniref:Uncharacterized protein n=1 Tax=Vigna mungo TaxID=3915 RepID=A0AAQ3S6R3_VIGMU
MLHQHIQIAVHRLESSSKNCFFQYMPSYCIQELRLRYLIIKEHVIIEGIESEFKPILIVRKFGSSPNTYLPIINPFFNILILSTQFLLLPGEPFRKSVHTHRNVHHHPVGESHRVTRRIHRINVLHHKCHALGFGRQVVPLQWGRNVPL